MIHETFLCLTETLKLLSEAIRVAWFQ